MVDINSGVDLYLAKIASHQTQLTLYGHIKTAEQRIIIQQHRALVGTLAVDGWAFTFGTARRGLGGLGPRQSPPRSLYQM